MSAPATIFLKSVLTNLRKSKRKSKAKNPGDQSPFRFFDLPRELRDEIYGYLVLFSVERRARTVPHKSNLPDYEKPGLDLRILRVNKQIHEEASRILYSRNVFPMRVVLKDSLLDDSNIFTSGFYCDVDYETPWDKMRHCASGTRMGRYFHLNASSWGRDLRRPNEESQPPLGSHYRHLIRQCRVEIIDARSAQHNFRFHRTVGKEQELLVPFAERLRILLGEAGDAVTLHLMVIPASFSPKEPSDNVGTAEVSNSEKGEEERIAQQRAIERMQITYKELIESAWPLTKGSWNFSLAAPIEPELEPRFETLKDEVFRQCDEDADFNDQRESSLQALRVYNGYWSLINGIQY